ncbi:ArsR/SmtB family transcription factor [Roseateles sp.]|uniref:ArsR/SmtB family transcription factor n=1 Tax=Roseateles sp. TaxID=1971397 RepID=UPI0039E949ED
MTHRQEATEAPHDPLELAAGLFKALGNRDRLCLLTALQREELCVGELERQLCILQPTLSQQLTVLRRYGLVATRRAGKRVYYHLADRHARFLMTALQGLAEAR